MTERAKQLQRQIDIKTLEMADLLDRVTDLEETLGKIKGGQAPEGVLRHEVVSNLNATKRQRSTLKQEVRQLNGIMAGLKIGIETIEDAGIALLRMANRWYENSPRQFTTEEFRTLTASRIILEGSGELQE